MINRADTVKRPLPVVDGNLKEQLEKRKTALRWFRFKREDGPGLVIYHFFYFRWPAYDQYAEAVNAGLFIDASPLATVASIPGKEWRVGELRLCALADNTTAVRLETPAFFIHEEEGREYMAELLPILEGMASAATAVSRPDWWASFGDVNQNDHSSSSRPIMPPPFDAPPAGNVVGKTPSKKEGLNRKERGVLDAIDALRSQTAQVTNALIALHMMEHDIYNERTGEAYSAEEISRTKSKLRKRGHDV